MPSNEVASQKTSGTAARLLPLDALRGLIMALMALDHTSLFVAHKHAAGEHWGGEFPSYSSALPFLTRLVTHLCAPGFSFLMGTGMWLFAQSRRKMGWSRWAVTRHFLVRGALLIALQFLVENQAWRLSPGWQLDVYVGVLFALGGTMILGSLLVWLKPPALLVLTVVLAVGTELLVPNPILWGQRNSPLDLLLLLSGGDSHLWSNYPVLPWLKFVTFGMLFGHWLLETLSCHSERSACHSERSEESLPGGNSVIPSTAPVIPSAARNLIDRQPGSRKPFTRALILGAALLLAFVVVRYLNGFGNIRPRVGDGWIAFLNVVKYPPSIAFSLLTMGVNLLLLGLFGLASARLQRFLQPLAVFGRAPLFFYIVHLFLYAVLGLWLTPAGTSIAGMYPYWLLGLLLMFPLTWLYGRWKHRQPPNSILRFL